MKRNPFDLLTEALQHLTVVDLSTDVTLHSEGPFSTRSEVLEADVGARFFVERVLPKIAPHLVGSFGAEDFPGGRFLRHEMITASVHAGSHIDAPGHYGGKLSAGSFVNDAKIEDFICPGVLFDAFSIIDREVRWEHAQEIIDRENIGDISGHIALIRIGPTKAISAELVTKLLDRGVKVIGTDNSSFDGAFLPMLEAHAQTREPSALWPCHVLGRDRPYFQIENLTNLDQLPATRFFVWAPPVLIGGATAAWTRIVALVPKLSSGQ